MDDLAQRFAGFVFLRRIAQPEDHRAALHREVKEGDAGLPKSVAHRVLDRSQVLGDHGVDIDLHQEMRSAPQIEPKIDLFVRQPVGQTLGYLARYEIRRGEGQSEDANHKDQDDLPTGNMDHAG